MYLDDTLSCTALCEDESAERRTTPQADLFAARDGNTAALGAALENCQQRLLYVAARDLNGQLSSKADAADLVQQTFLEAWRDFHRFYGDNLGELEAWLVHLLRNNVRDFVARHRTRNQSSLDREVALDQAAMELIAERSQRAVQTVVACCEARELEERLAQAIGRLPSGYRQVIVWRHGDHLRFGEIGQQMGITQNAARKLWVRAIAQLRDQLGELRDAS